MQPISISPRSALPKVTLTAAAAAKVSELMAREEEEELVLRLGVHPGGCSGFSYEMFFDTSVDDTDHVSETDGVRLAVDNRSMEMLNGAEVDYRDSLQGAGFHISNPNQTRTCGCGQSFS
jgi:iron-sulfur cluster assembly protein/iron-sulfur cluster insertion protein